MAYLRILKRLFPVLWIIGGLLFSCCNTNSSSKGAPVPPIESSASTPPAATSVPVPSPTLSNFPEVTPQKQIPEQPAVSNPSIPAPSETRPTFKTESEEAVTLKMGAVAVRKTEHQVFNTVCTAKRSWIEFQQLGDANAAETINRRIRKAITVGKALTEADCPDPSDGETYEYSNESYLRGEWKRFVGIHTSVIFPGGSGRVANQCGVFDLQTGKQYDLHKFLKKSAADRLKNKIATQAEKDNTPSSYFPINLDWEVFCLDDNGISASIHPDSATAPAIWSELVIPFEEVDTFFDLPDVMKEDVKQMATIPHPG